MPVSWTISDNNLVTFKATGKLGMAEYQQIQSEIETLIQKVGYIKIVVLLEGFEGWEAAKGWEDTSTDAIDPYIKKFVIVGDEKWRDLATVFTLQGLRPVPIEYFSTDQYDAAMQWLNND